MSRITVLMPVFNGLPYIQEAVNSVLTQSFENWELIVGDNGSTDGTLAYLETLKDPRIRIFRHKINLGIFGNLNFLLGECLDEVAKILCADDVLLPGALARTIMFMGQRPRCAVSRCWRLGDAERYAPGQGAALEGALPSSLQPMASTMAFATFGNIVGNLSKASCRPKLVLAEGGFDQSLPYAGDYEGWVRVAKVHGISLQNEELIFERLHSNQNSVLLNQRNELYPQINFVIERLLLTLPPQDHAMLRRHWTIHFIAPRLSTMIRQCFAGETKLACKVLEGLPAGIRAASVLAAYPLWRYNLSAARATTRSLYRRVIDLAEGLG